MIGNRGRRLVAGPVPFLVAAVLAGCGAQAGRPVARPHARQATATAPAPLGRRDLERGLWSAARSHLRELVVAAGGSGETGDIGQPLPTGLIDTARCRPSPAGPAPWRCRLRWIDEGGRRALASYDVRTGPGCFAAEARPALLPVHDVTIKTDTEHPLQSLASGSTRC